MNSIEKRRNEWNGHVMRHGGMPGLILQKAACREYKF